MDLLCILPWVIIIFFAVRKHACSWSYELREMNLILLNFCIGYINFLPFQFLHLHTGVIVAVVFI